MDRSRLTRPRTAPVLLAFGGAVALLLLVLSAITIRSDVTEFLPRGETQAARLVLDEARTGASTGLILVALEGTDPANLARISRTMAGTLAGSGLFRLVAGGAASIPPGAIEWLFALRYLLADADWSEAGLHANLVGLLRQMAGAAAPLATRFGLRDPAGAARTLLGSWAATSPVRTVDGAWFAPDRDRALLLARTKAGGMDAAAQEEAAAAIERAFAAADPGAARLLLTGPAIFGRDAARAIRGDVERLSIVSTVLVALLLWWRFRSPLVIAAIAAPVVASVALAALLTQLTFGYVHGVALGFGATMLGISVDYPVLMIGHRKRGEAAPATRVRIGRAFLLAVATATIGLSAMIASAFPGLRQLGVFAAGGLLACAALTWFGLPRLIVAADLAPVPASDAWLPRVERFRRYRLLVLVPIVAAILYLAAIGGPRWQGDLAALSPVPDSARALDRELRAELGAVDAGHLILVSGPTADAVLEREEALLPALDRLVAAHVLTGFDLASTFLPSPSRQATRQASIPERPVLAARLDAARDGLPFRPDAFDPFLAEAEAARTLPPLRLSNLAGTPLAARLDPLLAPTPTGWRGPVVLHGVTDPARLAAALPDTPDVTLIDTRAELGTILAHATTSAWRWLAGSAVLMLLVVAAGLRRIPLALRTLGAVAAAMLCTVALLTAAGEALSLIHLVALLLVAGVGLDYALFFARRQLDDEERARTLRTLVTCNAMTLLTFGLLATCQTPLLRSIGQTVGAGALLAFLFAFFGAGERV